jgi:nucleoid-associated protein YgaU
VGEATADASGRFVAFLEIAPSPEPRALSLRQADGAQGPDTVLLAPTAAPAVALASAVPGVEGVVQLAAPSAALPSRAAPADGAAGPNPAAPAGRPDPAPGSAAAPLVVVTVPAQPARPEPPAQAAVLLSDEGGVRVLQPAVLASADPEVLATVALDAISYDGAGEVLVQGRGTPGDAVRLYLDNVPAAEAAIAPDGTWATPLTKAEPGTYTLRLDQLDAAGEVVSRIETPFLRERRDDLAAASAQAGFRIVQPGNTLWAIARDRYGEPMMYVRVFEANRDRIRNPDLIYPGQVFLLPDADAL